MTGAHPSRHYEHRSDRTIQTLKATLLVDTDTGAALDVDCSARWPADTRVGQRVALRNAGDLYGQRWMAETAFSAIKCRFGAAVRPRVWYHQCRELMLTAAVYNIEQSLKR